MDRKIVHGGEDDASEKKSLVIDGDEYSIGAEIVGKPEDNALSEEEEEKESRSGGETPPEEEDKPVGEEESNVAEKKKKKKKEKAKSKDEKPKKAPKHVRAMQEALARRKEAEEMAEKEAEETRRREEEQERLKQEELHRLAEEARLRKEEKLLKKKQGKLLTPKQKEEKRRREAMRNQILSNAGNLALPFSNVPFTKPKRPLYQKKQPKPSSQYPSKEETGNNVTEMESLDVNDDKKKEISVETNLRSPICCIMGHVDTGKTKLLDCIRCTNVQEGEAGGITQQIGATYFPAENIRDRTRELKADAKLNVPGLLVIDTPGHETFTNLRSRGSGLCDIAVLVVDIMHGLEPQTIESLNLLEMRNTEFIIALNKVDRLYGWRSTRNAPIVKSMKQQSKNVRDEFNMRLTQIVTQFKEQGLNTELYYRNREMGETFSIVPTSAITGEGVPDLLLLLVQWSQKTMVEKLTFSNEIQCTVLEVKVVEGHGTTIDVILVNGVIHEGEQIVVCGIKGPIVTTIRALLTPYPMKELRVKGTYLHHKEIKAAQGIKITARGLEHAIAGTSLHVVGAQDDLEAVKKEAEKEMKSVMSRIHKGGGEGVFVQASTLGSLEALLEFLKTPEVNIPVGGISIGHVHKKDVKKASAMLGKKKEFATILAFDVKVTPEACKLADNMGVKIFMADIIYHLFDQFKAYVDNLKEEKKEAAQEAVFPCVLQIVPNCIFNKTDPIVLGVDVIEGIAKVGTPICIPQRGFIDIGRIASIQNNHNPVNIAGKGQKVSIKIIGSNMEEQQRMFGRHFDIEDELVSHISRKSIDELKANCTNYLSREDWKLVVKLKTLFKIQ